jgi:hypothetical protein
MNEDNEITTKTSESEEPSGFAFDDNVFLFGLADNANYDDNNDNRTDNDSTKNNSNINDNTIDNNDTNNSFENSNNEISSREKESSSDTPFRSPTEYGKSLGDDVGAGMGLVIFEQSHSSITRNLCYVISEFCRFSCRWRCLQGRAEQYITCFP